MSSSRFFALSAMLILALGMFSSKAACKRKKRARKPQVSAASYDSVKVYPAPGVPNKAGFDSLKQAKMLDKLRNGQALVVSFISLASGIDAAAEKQFLGLLEGRKPCGLMSEKTTWGREGERDYCLLSSDTECMKQFTAELRKTFSGNRRVLIKENATCKPKNQ